MKTCVLFVICSSNQFNAKYFEVGGRIILHNIGGIIFLWRDICGKLVIRNMLLCEKISYRKAGKESMSPLY